MHDIGIVLFLSNRSIRIQQKVELFGTGLLDEALFQRGTVEFGLLYQLFESLTSNFHG
jgi:hypothetical protein